MSNIVAESIDMCKLRSANYNALDAFQITVDKDIAEYLLSFNLPNNRKPSQLRVSQYRRQMLNGEWMIGDPIKISKDKVLIDGQHRLMAIKDDMKVPMVVMTGLPSQSAEYLDQGIKRNAVHIAKIRGLSGIGSQEISTLRLMFLFRFPDMHDLNGSTGKLSPVKIVGILEKHPEILEAIKLSQKYSQQVNGVRFAPFFAAIARAHLSDYPLSGLDLDYFCYCLQYGKESGYSGKDKIVRVGGAPCILRHTYLQTSRGMVTGTDRPGLFYKAQSALIAYKEGKDVNHLKPTKRNCFRVPLIDQMNMRTLDFDSSIPIVM